MSPIEHDHKSRLLNWDGCPNARDLGGLPTVGGGDTRRTAVVRSDSPHRLSPIGRQSLIDHGVRAIVDLRLPDEAAQYSYPFATPGDHGITYVNVSFVDPAASGDELFVRLADLYKTLLDRHRAQVANAIRAIARAPEGGVLIHCAAGKDRTGLISALLLDLVRVPRELIAEDYALSSNLLRERSNEWIAESREQQAEREADVARWWSTPEVMREVLAFLDEGYGGTDAYLRRGGVGEDDLARIRERLTS